MTDQTALPQIDGELTADGLDAPVRVVRDRWGVPHAEAQSARDAFFAQGFCLGQDRGWQLELYRHMAHGRAASLLNKGLLRIDKLNRTLGFGRDAAREWEEQSDEARMILQAYADGINSAIAVGPAPVEFGLLEHEMQPWSPVDSLAILKMVSANVHWATKIGNGEVASRLGIEALEALIPDVPADAALIAPAGASWTNGAPRLRRRIGRPRIRARHATRRTGRLQLLGDRRRAHRQRQTAGRRRPAPRLQRPAAVVRDAHAVSPSSRSRARAALATQVPSTTDITCKSAGR